MADSTDQRIFVAGHRGLVGRAIVRALERRKTAGEKFELLVPTRDEVDLTDASAVRAFFNDAQPTHVILAAAKVGGIKANSDSAVDFLLQNLKIQNNVIESAHSVGVRKQIGRAHV